MRITNIKKNRKKTKTRYTTRQVVANNSNTMMNILDMNVDCLLEIFKHTSENDLHNLCLSNKYLNDIIERHVFYPQTLDLLMSGHRNTPAIIGRTQTPLTYWDRNVLSQNWNNGCYTELELFYHKQMFPTKVHLEHDKLYLTHTNYIRRYKRNRTESVQRRYECEIGGRGFKSDIADFAKKGDTMFAGRTCGNCFIYDCATEDKTDQQLHSPKEYLYCVDFVRNIYATSTNSRAKVWRRADEFGLVHLDLVHNLPNAYKSLKITSGGEKIYGGLYTDKQYGALREINVETGEELVLNSRTISIYDIKLKDDNVVFTANFDATFRLYDRRTDRDECIWNDPFNSSFYCLDYDGLYGVLAGTKYYGRVNLFDIRVPTKYAQLYFPRRGHLIRSPVYSICCDSRYLIFGTDHSVRIMDFKVGHGYARDHRYIFNSMRHY